MTKQEIHSSLATEHSILSKLANTQALLINTTDGKCLFSIHRNDNSAIFDAVRIYREDKVAELEAQLKKEL